MKRSPFLTKGKATGETVQPGIFVAGDILSFEGKSANAVNSIKTYLERTAYRHGLVSLIKTAPLSKNNLSQSFHP